MRYARALALFPGSIVANSSLFASHEKHVVSACLDMRIESSSSTLVSIESDMKASRAIDLSRVIRRWDSEGRKFAIGSPSAFVERYRVLTNHELSSRSWGSPTREVSNCSR